MNHKKIVLEIYEELFNQSNPKLDFMRMYDELIKGEHEYINQILGKEHDKLFHRWFLRFYLSEEEQDKIIDRIIKKYRLRLSHKKSIRTEIILGCSPTTVKEIWEENK